LRSGGFSLWYQISYGRLVIGLTKDSTTRDTLPNPQIPSRLCLPNLEIALTYSRILQSYKRCLLLLQFHTEYPLLSAQICLSRHSCSIIHISNIMDSSNPTMFTLEDGLRDLYKKRRELSQLSDTATSPELSEASLASHQYVASSQSSPTVRPSTSAVPREQPEDAETTHRSDQGTKRYGKQISHTSMINSSMHCRQEQLDSTCHC
jgi:hypothetical protein